MSGFTLIELLLYLSIAAIVIFAVVVVLRMSQEAKVKSAVIGAVERNGAFLADDINHSVRGSGGISSPGVIGASDAVLIYYEPGSQEDTRIYLEEGVVYSHKKNTLPVALTDKTVIVENLLFTRMNSLGNGIHIMYSFSAKGSSPSSAYEYSYQRKFSGGASIQIN